MFSYQEFSEYGSSGTEHVCATYSSDQIDNFLDGPFKAARAFAVLANIFVGAGALALVFASCAYFEIVLLHGCGWLLIIGSVCEALTFLLYASKVTDGPHNGRFWWGSGLAIASSIAALFAGILTIRLPPSERESTLPSSSTDSEANKRPQADSPVVSEQARPMRPGTETTTESILPDGRRKYTTTKWNKDGTKTVEETIE